MGRRDSQGGFKGGLRYCLIAALAVALAACGGAAQVIPAGEPPAMRPGEALVVFMRPSNFGGLVASSVFDVTSAETKFVGIIYPGHKFGYALPPGEHTFMVVGESADFMRATVAAGRTYYALVTPRVGVWKARFSFRPVRENELAGSEFASWDAATSFVTNSPASLNWAQQNAADVNSKRAEYWSEWMSKPLHQQQSQTLQAQDGKPSAVATAAPAPQVSRSSPVTPSDAGVETMFWESIRQSSNPADFRAYLEQYPQGRFAALARNRLAALGQTAPPAAAPAVPKPSGRLPQGGDTWTYRLVEPKRADGVKQRDYRVKVATVSDAGIVEQYSVGQEASREWTHERGNYLVALGAPLFSPYLGAFVDLRPFGTLGGIQMKEGACTTQYICQAAAKVLGNESITVPAGTFRTVRVEVEHSWRPSAISGTFGTQLNGGRRMTVWYAPEVKRAIKFSSRATFGTMPPVEQDFDLELITYQVQ